MQCKHGVFNTFVRGRVNIINPLAILTPWQGCRKLNTLQTSEVSVQFVVNASSRTVASLRYDHECWIFSTGQLVACCCCPCVAGQSTGCWDGMGDASSFGQGDGRVRSTWHRSAWWAGISSESLSNWRCINVRSHSFIHLSYDTPSFLSLK